MNILSRSHRILKRLAPYRSYELSDDFPGSMPSLDSGDCWVGVYYNVPDKIDNAVLFSMTKMYVKKEETWKSVSYSDIRQSQIVQQKPEADEILLITDASSMVLQICGGSKKARDAYEVLRFINRVREDLLRQNQQA